MLQVSLSSLGYTLWTKRKREHLMQQQRTEIDLINKSYAQRKPTHAFPRFQYFFSLPVRHFCFVRNKNGFIKKLQRRSSSSSSNNCIHGKKTNMHFMLEDTLNGTPNWCENQWNKEQKKKKYSHNKRHSYECVSLKRVLHTLHMHSQN